jgi:hypothetical protein
LLYLYQLVVLGSPSTDQVTELEHTVAEMVQAFGLKLGYDVGWVVNPNDLHLQQKVSTSAIFFGAENASEKHLQTLLDKNISIIPIVSSKTRVQNEIPAILKPLNCLSYQDGHQRIATALLECVGLLPRQRRVFVSYRRNEASQAASQLFDQLSARLFDVFLDTHGIAPAEDFQTVLWHRLCDSDVLIMLDTPGYFESRWTSAEFGRALAKGISVLRVAWPGVAASKRTTITNSINLLEEDIDTATGYLKDKTIIQICSKVEALRSQSHAVRSLNLVSLLRREVERIGASVAGVGMNKSVYIQLADGRDIVVHPTVGVPTSTTLHEAIKNSPECSTAVVFDHVGLHPNWIEHLEWLGSRIQAPRWVKAHEVAWQFAAWEE